MHRSGTDLKDLQEARRIVDTVFETVRTGSLYERPIPERHRLIFYVGHVDAFDINLLAGQALSAEPEKPELNRLFAFGIDPEPGKLPSDQPGDWPELSEVSDYCSEARESVDRAWDYVPEQLRHVALEHRLMHAETLAYMLHNLPAHHLNPPVAEESVETLGSVTQEPREIPAGEAILGRKHTDGFGWDNEFDETRVPLASYLIDRWKVTNGQYLEFVKEGGQVPFFWIERDGKWYLRRMFDEIPLPLDWPVYVTHQQAQAFADWRGAELPTEAEWQFAAYGTTSGKQRPYPWGEHPPAFGLGNFAYERHDPSPVTSHPSSASAFGVEDLCGNGWEWTSSLFRPLPGFEPFSFYPGYSADFFDNDHYVLKGASPRTDSVFLRNSFRNWFRKDYPYVFATFRCIGRSR